MDNEMKYVYEVYCQKSFSRAAEKLFVSQSAVSAMVRRAEERIGCQIFDRSTIPFTLTEEGRHYIAGTEKIQKLERDLFAYFDDRRQLKTGSLSLGSSTFYCSYYLTRIAKAFREKRPGIHIDMVEGDGTYLEQWLQEGKIDFLFGAISLHSKDMTRRFYAYEDMVLVVPAQFEVNERLLQYQISWDSVRTKSFLRDGVPAVPLWELRACPFVTLTRQGSDLYQRTYQICRNAGFMPKVELFLSQIMTAYYMAVSGMGATFARTTLFNMLPESSAVVFYKVGDPLARRAVSVIYNANRYVTHAMQEFLDLTAALPQSFRI